MKSKPIPLELSAIDVRVRYACGCFVFQQVRSASTPVESVWGTRCSKHRQSADPVTKWAKKEIQSLLKDANS